MRILNYILILCVALLASGCDNGTLSPEGDDDNVIVVPDGGPYIYLDAEVGNKTKGTLIEGKELQEDFGAYGFTYDFTNRWTTYRATATPNVFKDDDDDFVAVQKVTYDEGIYSYEPVQEWSGGKYTFFAYYPYDNDSVTASDMDVEGTPYVIYAPVDFLISTANHTDVMTAMFQDTSLSSSQYVDFDFQHRLSAIEVVALNFYEYNHEDAGGNVTTEKIEIEITDLNITFENLKYKEAKLYLDSSIPSENTSLDIDEEPTYDIVSSGSKSIAYSSTSEFQRIDPDQTLLVIPQTEEDLAVTTTVRFKKKRPDGTYLSDEGDIVTYISSKDTEFGQALKAGSRYYIQITFTSAAVSINILTSAEWEDLAEDVYHEFE
ncbi:MAG: fimbrillin family protein [Bacteroidales bacterium]|nr:fimbrillin family protein [Bacteroidales bacterium]